MPATTRFYAKLDLMVQCPMENGQRKDAQRAVSAFGKKYFHRPPDVRPTYWTISQPGSAVVARDQMSAW